MEKQQQKLEDIILNLNKSGLSYLTHQQFEEAFQYFKQAQKIMNKHLRENWKSLRINKLAGITYNNLACYYKKINKPKISLIYLQKALDIEVHRVEDWSATASTHLNICAIHSYLHDHEAAANHAELAIHMLQKLDQKWERKLNLSQHSDEDRSVANLHMLAHYNLAIEFQYLKQYDQSIEEFLKAKEWAKKLGKKNIAIISACDQSIDRMKQIMKNLKNKLHRIVNKKRIEEERGHYSYMRNNRKNALSKIIHNSQQHLPKSIKALKIHDEKPSTHYRSRSIMRVKTDQRHEDIQKNINSSFSYL